MKKLFSIIILCFPLFASANTVFQTPNYELTVRLSEKYDESYKEENVKGISIENKGNIYQQSGMFKSISPENQNKDAVGSFFLVSSTFNITNEILINKTLGWLVKDELIITDCPKYQFLNFVPTCYLKILKNEVREVSFMIYSAINKEQTDAIV